MKWRVTKAAYEKLSDDMKSEYEEAEDKKGYTLIVEGAPEADDTGELKRANIRLKEEKNNLQEELDEANGKVEKLEKSKTTGDKDVERVTARFEKKLNETKAEYDARVAKLHQNMSKSVMDAAAGKLAAEISTSPNVIMPHITSRLTVEFDADDVPTLKVLKDGKASELKIDDLKKELVDNKDFSSIIRATKASGGGASTSNPLNPGSAGSGAEPGKPVDLSKATPESRQALRDRVAAKIEAKQSAAA